ncbi:MAG: nuclear transport factor 2 family protein [Fusobacterium gastrosuis]|uniref:nuclear transport factor 2 family protein n=1 Tax=Fusobacterium gastrosuis TaxID=1755100 RepID=UPI002A8AFD5D|nr:nuclear transport factor 2 family protein [Fusobacterium gastrosuis]
MNIFDYWKYTLEQNKIEMKKFFNSNAKIFWHNTNEIFTVDEYINVNCCYPGNWFGEIEKIEIFCNLIITVTQVFSDDKNISLKAISFIKILNDKIIQIDEYWSENTEPPQWRKDMKIGETIND